MDPNSKVVDLDRITCLIFSFAVCLVVLSGFFLTQLNVLALLGNFGQLIRDVACVASDVTLTPSSINL